MADYIYSDFNIRLILNSNNDITKITDNDSIANSIKNIVNTKKGERLFNPDFGTNLRYYLFDPITVLTAEEIKSDLIINIRRYEPRISDISVEVFPMPESDEYLINIIYREQLTEEEKTLTFNIGVTR